MLRLSLISSKYLRGLGKVHLRLRKLDYFTGVSVSEQGWGLGI